eukprot:CFRG3465T1
MSTTEESTTKAAPAEIHDAADGKTAGTPATVTTVPTSKSETSKSVESMTADKNAGEEDSEDEVQAQRFKDLLSKSELFAQYVEQGRDVSRFRKLSQSGELSLHNTPSKVSQPGDSRHRRTEAEEDEELMNESGKDKQVFMFHKSPTYVEGGEMREYQIRGLNWMISLYQNGISGILADEMGLGKTLQTISLLGWLKIFQKINGPHLVIVPLSTQQNWMNEFKRWVPSLRVYAIHGQKEVRQASVKENLVPGKWDCVVASYEQVILEKAAIRKFHWEYIVIDEAHRIKNENSKLSGVIREFKSKHRLLITGTPLQNNMHELWALLNFLMPQFFGSSDDFDDWFRKDKIGKDESAVQRLHQVLKPFLLRRLKADVEKSLLPKIETKVYVGLSDMQLTWYRNILKRDIDILQGGNSKGNGKVRLMNILMQLRKVSNHPYLFEGAEPGPPYELVDLQHMVDASGKLKILDKLLTKLKDQGSRVLIFSQMTRMLDILEDFCLWKGYNHCRLDGSTGHAERQDMIDEYNKDGSEKFVFLLSTRSGGLGINLATADSVIIYDSDWNPQMDLQAMDRAHRIGQKKQVRVFRMITDQTVEERIVERAEMKLRLDALVIQQGRLSGQKTQLGKEEIYNMIQCGADHVFRATGSTVTDADIEAILDDSMQRTKDFEKKLKDKGIDDLQQFSLEDTAVQLYDFEGKDWKSMQGVTAPKKSFYDIGKRDAAKQTVNYNENVYFRDALRVTEKKEPSKPKPPKSVIVEQHFFYAPRLLDLVRKEKLAYWRQIGYRPPASDDTIEAKIAQQEEQAEIDTAEPLTEEEIAEKEKLEQEGFSSWGKSVFTKFRNACAQYGRHDYASIASVLETKTENEVEEYSKVFWKRYKEIDGWEGYIKAIEAGEEKIQKRENLERALMEKVSSYRDPFLELEIAYTGSTKNYTEDEDRFMICMLAKLGVGTENVHDAILREIRMSSQFRFDWFIKSRTAAELLKRCNQLLAMIEKENDEAGGGKKRGNSGSSKSGAKKVRK